MSVWLKLSYEDLRLRVVNDPVGQCVVVELLLRLFVLHILGASPDCVAQPEGMSVEHRVWTSDGVAASLTSLGCQRRTGSVGAGFLAWALGTMGCELDNARCH